MKSKSIAIAIDGPAAAGKSTVAKLVANKLSFIYIDTGAMYRALTKKALDEKINLDDEQSLVELLKQTEINLKQNEKGQMVCINGNDATLQIRMQDVTNNVSYVAKHPLIREEMVNRQQKLAEKRSVVMDGRDIGTHVLPHAEVKIFLVASAEERAKRRHKENLQKGFPSNIEKLKAEIERRDSIDTKREIAPLVKADDAVEINTTTLTIDDVANRILKIAEQKLQL
ncbi:(d)CMP kinase [Virgibacillus alimentarius]|uniref:Cytidylate kinase n=1 Tax=Virgibacillus alimentarius TaxID=698769 RepID=A0ABS4S4H8_9BACI|nr:MULTISPECIES: (d)CMP kinase [Virgibacillus]MBP2256395.1 cytidylate kinase [Virgibacillus alimentarius]HLR66340.1 (d)CMP kinase [Virgibacillus sp.]